MLTLADKKTEQAHAVGVRFVGNILYVALNDGREIEAPLNRIKWLDWLAHAEAKPRANWSIEPGGFAIYWNDLDDGIEVRHLLEMPPLN